jgi:hypothetical protein
MQKQLIRINHCQGGKMYVIIGLIFDFWCFNATLSNISAISWRPVLVVEDAGVPGENHRPWASMFIKF